MEYLDKKEGGFTLIRKVVDVAKPGNEWKTELMFETFIEAFEYFEKMYRMDKEAWQCLVRKDSHASVYYSQLMDSSKHPGEYTFTVGNRMLVVRLLDIEEVAKSVFRTEE